MRAFLFLIAFAFSAQAQVPVPAQRYIVRGDFLNASTSQTTKICTGGSGGNLFRITGYYYVRTKSLSGGTLNAQTSFADLSSGRAIGHTTISLATSGQVAFTDIAWAQPGNTVVVSYNIAGAIVGSPTYNALTTCERLE